MSQSEQLKILLNVESKLAELNKTVSGVDELGREISDTTRETQSANKEWNSFNHALKQGVGLGIATAAMQGLIRTLRQAPRAVLGLVKDYGIQQQAELGLAAAIRAHGGAAEALLPKYKQIASAIQSVTTVGDEQTLAMMATATQMGINSGQMEQTIKGAIGLSKAFGLDLTMAARASAAAVQGNTSLLTRYIPALANVSDETEKMRLVSEGMTNGYTQATEEAKSATGQMEQLGSTLGDVREKFGEALAGGILPAVKGTKTLAEGFQKVPTPVIAAGAALTTAAVAGGGLSLALAKVNVQSLIAAARIGMTGKAALAATPGIRAMSGALRGAGAATAALVGWEIGKWADEFFGISDKAGELAQKWEDFRKVSIEGTDELAAGLQRAIDQADGLAAKEVEIDQARQKAQAARQKSLEAREAGNRRLADAHAEEAMQLFEVVRQSMVKLDLVEKQIEKEEQVTQAAEARVTLNRQELDLIASMQDPRAELAESANLEHRLLLAKIDGNEELIALLEEQIDLSRDTTANFEHDNKILRARIAGDEERLESLREQREVAEIIARLEKGGVTAEKAIEMAEERVRLNRAAAAAEKKRREDARNQPVEADGNEDLRTRLGLLDEVGQKEQQTKQLRAGVRAQRFIDFDGKEKLRYFEGGKLLGDSDEFGKPGDPVAVASDRGQGRSAPAQSSDTRPPSSSAPGTADTSGVTAALQSVTLDTSAIESAVAEMQTRIQDQLDNLASQIRENSN